MVEVALLYLLSVSERRERSEGEGEVRESWAVGLGLYRLNPMAHIN